ncbi:MAG: Gx transporter family protein [Oscillospiraceae bacterium]|nr:Gx transporter family protein [Oscillospiraceae bacterium]
MNINPFKSASRYAALTGLMLALALTLTALESTFSAFLPAGVRIGLANVAVLGTAVCVNIPTAFLITLLKSVFVLLTRGVSAGAMSICGGIAAFSVTALLLSKTRSSYVMISVLSAISHIIGQLAMASVLTGSAYTFYYAPLLIATGTASGFITGTVSGRVIPLLEKNLSAHRKQ